MATGSCQVKDAPDTSPVGFDLALLWTGDALSGDEAPQRLAGTSNQPGDEIR
jgi:hypothetical protein